MKNEDQYIVPYKVYMLVLSVLLALTFFSVAISEIYLGSATVAVVLLLASVKAYLVLKYFMHLKYDKPYIVTMVIFVFAILLVTIIFTFLDYLFR